jgi:hypothetical protein
MTTAPDPPQEDQAPVEGCTRDDPCPDCANRPATFDGQPRCTAWSSQRHHRCNRARHPGAVVCASHGASAPQVQAKARLRLLELVDPATAVLATILTDRNAKPADRLRAVENIYDRAGIPRRTQVDVSSAQELLMVRIREVLARRAQAPLPPSQDTVAGELVTGPDERMEA